MAKRSKRFEVLANRPADRDRFAAAEWRDVGLIAMNSSLDPGHGIRAERGRLLEMDGKRRENYDMKAMEPGKRYEEVNLIVAHLGGGITVGAQRRGRLVDVSSGVDGEVPFTPNRSGTQSVVEVTRLTISGRFTREELKSLISERGGFVAYLGANSAREVEERAEAGDARANLLFLALCYQISKEIGASAALPSGEVDAIVLTGDLARSRRMVHEITEMIKFLAPVFVCPGEDEMAALYERMLRVLRGQENARSYQESRANVPRN